MGVLQGSGREGGDGFAENGAPVPRGEIPPSAWSRVRQDNQSSGSALEQESQGKFEVGIETLAPPSLHGSDLDCPDDEVHRLQPHSRSSMLASPPWQRRSV